MKLNIDKLREKMANENKGRGRQKDPTFLNYYDLKFGQKIVIRLLPASDDNDIYLSYATHGGALRNRSVKSIRCVYESDNESCPACAHSYEHFTQGDKKEAARWRNKETFLAQCIVVSSDIELDETEDGNPVRKLYLPYKVKEYIRNAIVNEIVEDPMAHNFVLAKTQGHGDNASYETSSFQMKVVDFPEDVLEMFDEGTAYLYDLNEDMPERATVDEVKVWLQEAIEAESGEQPSRDTSGPSGSDDDDDDAPEQEEAVSTTAASLRDRLRRTRG